MWILSEKIKYICYNEGISGETLLKLQHPDKYANRRIWPLIKDDQRLLDNLSENEFFYLCKNPLAVEYVTNQSHRLTDLCVRELIHNQGAIEYCQNNVHGSLLLIYGTRYPHFYPYFDFGLIERNKELITYIANKLFANPAAREYIRENFEYIQANSWNNFVFRNSLLTQK